MEIEESVASVSHMDTPDADEEGLLPPEYARIHDFYCQPLPTTTASKTGKTYTLHPVTFETKPDGPHREPRYHIESIWMRPETILLIIPPYSPCPP